MIKQIIRSTEIINTDCMTYMATVTDNHFDLVVYDPPYFDGPQKPGYYKGTKQKCEVGAYKNLNNWKIPGEEYFNELQRISKNQIIFGINYLDVKAPGGRIVWIKGNENSPFSMAEIAYQSFYNRIDTFQYLWAGFWKEAGAIKEARIHPTQKPIALYEWILNRYAKPGQKIFDSHLGSGSSAIAANNMGFEFVGCEIDPDCYLAACRRIDEHSRQERLFA